VIEAVILFSVSIQFILVHHTLQKIGETLDEIKEKLNEKGGTR
jgi:uncharacterized protein YoxC